MSLGAWVGFRAIAYILLGHDDRFLGLSLGLWDGIHLRRALMLNTVLEPPTFLKLVFGTCFDLGLSGRFAKMLSVTLGILLGYVLDELGPEILSQMLADIARRLMAMSKNNAISPPSVRRRSTYTPRRRRGVSTPQTHRLPEEADFRTRAPRSRDPLPVNRDEVVHEDSHRPNVSNTALNSVEIKEEDVPMAGPQKEQQDDMSDEESLPRDLAHSDVHANPFTEPSVGKAEEETSRVLISPPPLVIHPISYTYGQPISPLTPIIIIVPPSDDEQSFRSAGSPPDEFEPPDIEDPFDDANIVPVPVLSRFDTGAREERQLDGHPPPEEEEENINQDEVEEAREIPVNPVSVADLIDHAEATEEPISVLPHTQPGFWNDFGEIDTGNPLESQDKAYSHFGEESLPTPVSLAEDQRYDPFEEVPPLPSRYGLSGSWAEVVTEPIAGRVEQEPAYDDEDLDEDPVEGMPPPPQFYGFSNSAEEPMPELPAAPVAGPAINYEDFMSESTAPESLLSKGPKHIILNHAQGLRDQAKDLLEESQRYDKEKEEALRRGRVLEAFTKKMDRDEAKRRADEFHRKAARRYYAAHNATQLDGTIDVHGLKVAEAIRKTELELQNVQRRGGRNLRVIVGRGKHSPSGVPALKFAILEKMEKQRIPAHIDKRNPGVLNISLDGLR